MIWNFCVNSESNSILRALPISVFPINLFRYYSTTLKVFVRSLWVYHSYGWHMTKWMAQTGWVGESIKQMSLSWIHFRCWVWFLFSLFSPHRSLFVLLWTCACEVSWTVCNVFISCHYSPFKVWARYARYCFYVENLISFLWLIRFL